MSENHFCKAAGLLSEASEEDLTPGITFSSDGSLASWSTFGDARGAVVSSRFAFPRGRDHALSNVCFQEQVASLVEAGPWILLVPTFSLLLRTSHLRRMAWSSVYDIPRAVLCHESS